MSLAGGYKMTLKSYIEFELINFLALKHTVTQRRKLQCNTSFWLGANKG
jgi:hypothetical protein